MRSDRMNPNSSSYEGKSETEKRIFKSSSGVSTGFASNAHIMGSLFKLGRAIFPKQVREDKASSLLTREPSSIGNMGLINNFGALEVISAEPDLKVMHLTMSDVSTAGQIHAIVPWNCSLTKVSTVLNGAITSADSVLTVKNNAGSSAGTITVANGSSAAGDIDTLSPSSNNVFTAGQKVEIETSGASSNTVQLDITLEFTLTNSEIKYGFQNVLLIFKKLMNVFKSQGIMRG